MPFSGVDPAAVSRCLAPLVDSEPGLADAYFERLELAELPPDGEPPGIRLRHEEGLAVRLVRGQRSWSASYDRIDGSALGEAIRQVARARPRAAAPLPSLALAPPASAAEERDSLEELLRVPSRLVAALRRRRLGLPLRLTARRHRRDVLVVGDQVAAAPECETFYSLAVEAPWGRCGALLATADEASVEGFAGRLADRFRAREAPPPEAGRHAVVLGADAAAIFLHEAVAHALEVDTLALSGAPEGALGVELGSPVLDVLDDPAAAPEPVRRASDDEGVPVRRRWLLRGGRVEQLLADRRWAAASDRLDPGAGRRADRHHDPGPRSTFLELVTGSGSLEELLAAVGVGGLFFPEADRGSLDPRSGRFVLHLPYGYRLGADGREGPVGPCRLVGTVGGLLSAVARVGGEATLAGAGWCAKGGQKLPVWARTAPLVVIPAEIEV